MAPTAVVIMAKAPYPRAGQNAPLPSIDPVASSSPVAGLPVRQDCAGADAHLGQAGYCLYTRHQGRAFLPNITPDFTLIVQQGTDLGERLIRSLEYFLHLGCAGVMAIDSDTPTLPTHCLQQAIELLTRP